MKPLSSRRPAASARPAHPAAWVAAVLLALLPGAATAAGILRVEEGVARALGVGATLYREQHWVRLGDGAPLERMVLYRCPDGTAFARKRVDYRRSSEAPAFVLDDHRSGYREGLRWIDGAPRVFVREAAGAEESSAALPAAALVADAGFDQFIQRHWDALVGGRRLPLAFAVPARGRSLAFTVQKAGSAVVGGEKAWVFRLRLDGLLGLVAPGIDVSYGQASRRLLRFEGLSNLRDDAGQRQLAARIDFALPPGSGTEEQWRQAATRPLAACRTGR